MPTVRNQPTDATEVGQAVPGGRACGTLRAFPSAEELAGQEGHGVARIGDPPTTAGAETWRPSDPERAPTSARRQAVARDNPQGPNKAQGPTVESKTKAATVDPLREGRTGG